MTSRPNRLRRAEAADLETRRSGTPWSPPPATTGIVGGLILARNGGGGEAGIARTAEFKLRTSFGYLRHVSGCGGRGRGRGRSRPGAKRWATVRWTCVLPDLFSFRHEHEHLVPVASQF